MNKMYDTHMKFVEGSHVVVTPYYPIKDIVGLTGRVVNVNPFSSKYVRYKVKFDIPLDPSGTEYHWFCDADLEAIE